MVGHTGSGVALRPRPQSGFSRAWPPTACAVTEPLQSLISAVCPLLRGALIGVHQSAVVTVCHRAVSTRGPGGEAGTEIRNEQ